MHEKDGDGRKGRKEAVVSDFPAGPLVGFALLHWRGSKKRLFEPAPRWLKCTRKLKKRAILCGFRSIRTPVPIHFGQLSERSEPTAGGL